MKRMIVAAVLLVSTVSVFAADVKSEARNDQEKERSKNVEPGSFGMFPFPYGHIWAVMGLGDSYL